MVWLLLFFSIIAHAVTIDRVILASDTNPTYIQFWPIVAQAWKQLVGVKPTLILVAPSDVFVDERFGDVIRFEPIPGIPTSYQAQVIRLFAPTFFPDEVCIISDIDMLPLQKRYFAEQVRNIPDDMFIIYRDKADEFYESRQMYPMCYVAAKGSVFQDVFNVNPDTIREKLIEWYALNLGWCTDELMMAHCVNNWDKYPKKVYKLGNRGSCNIDRLHWGYDVRALKKGKLIDAHLLRPYLDHKQTIDQLLVQLNLTSVIDIFKIHKFAPTIINHDVAFTENVLNNEKIIISSLLEKNYSIMSAEEYEGNSFVHFLTLNQSAYNFLVNWRYKLENHQIGIIYFTNEDQNINNILHLCGECGYVVFKIMSDGLMHIPYWSSVLQSHAYSSYIACMPQYVFGWSSYKNKKG